MELVKRKIRKARAYVRPVAASVAAVGLAMLGIAAVSLVSAESVSAQPLTGTHTVATKCDDGAYHAQRKDTYTLTFVSYDAPSHTNVYHYTPILSNYTGTSSTSRPTTTLQSNGGHGLIINASHGGPWTSMNTDVIWPFGTAVGPSSTRTNGLAGVNWLGANISAKTDGTWQEPFMIVTWGNHSSCDIAIDLSDPNGPHVGSNRAVMDCTGPTAPDGSDALDLNYTITSVSGDTYNLKINSVNFTPNPGTISTNLTYTVDLHLDVIDSNGAVTSLDPTPGFSSLIVDPLPNHDPHSITVADGVGGVTFPTRSFLYVGGPAGTMPYIRANFIRQDYPLSNQTANDCQSHYDLGMIWGTASHPTLVSTQTIAFNDCQGGVQPHGLLTVTSNWLQNSNGERTRLQSLYVDNNSPMKLRIANPVGGGPRTARYMTDDGLGDELTWWNSVPSTADREWAPSSHHYLDINENAKWTNNFPLDFPNSAPFSMNVDQGESPAMVLDFHVYSNLFGTECTQGSLDLGSVVTRFGDAAPVVP